jgi:hypothetical protein
MQNTMTASIEKVTGAESIPFIESCISLDEITEQLKHFEQIVLTNNDGPFALMFKVDSSTLEDTILELRRLQMQMAIKTIQDASVKSGKSKMTLEEINAEITAARAERKE